jgi:hypothetical protein
MTHTAVKTTFLQSRKSKCQVRIKSIPQALRRLTAEVQVAPKVVIPLNSKVASLFQLITHHSSLMSSSGITNSRAVKAVMMKVLKTHPFMKEAPSP